MKSTLNSEMSHFVRIQANYYICPVITFTPTHLTTGILILISTKNDCFDCQNSHLPRAQNMYAQYSLTLYISKIFGLMIMLDFK